MNAKHRETLRQLRTLMSHVDPDGWFITRELPNRDVLDALMVVEEQELLLELADVVAKRCDELEKENARLKQERQDAAPVQKPSTRS
jgi:hypothetical protein